VIGALRSEVDTLSSIPDDPPSCPSLTATSRAAAVQAADQVLLSDGPGITDLITHAGLINLTSPT